MKVLVACEFSGIVREAFSTCGHDTWSCDLLPSEIPGQHIQGDISIALKQEGWNLMIAFPPCTHLASSGARWFSKKRPEQEQAIAFVRMLAGQQIPKIAIENPVGILSTAWRKPDQVIQPWMFGHGETKATCLWLQGLPLLRFSQNWVSGGRVARVHREPPGLHRWKNRSRTLQKIAKAMAEQWGTTEAFREGDLFA